MTGGLIGPWELVGGIGLYYLFGRQREETKLPDPNPMVVEVRRIMEEVRRSGGVDPLLLGRLKAQVRDRQMNVTVTDLNDDLRTFAELSIALRENAPEKDRRVINPAPAPNSRRAVNMTVERLMRRQDNLRPPSEVESPNVFLSGSTS